MKSVEAGTCPSCGAEEYVARATVKNTMSFRRADGSLDGGILYDVVGRCGACDRRDSFLAPDVHLPSRPPPWAGFLEGAPRPAPPRDSPPPTAPTTEPVAIGRQFVLERGECIVFGRLPAPGVVGLGLPTMARHFSVTVAPDGVATLVDVGSSGGIFVNESRAATCQLQSGDRIHLGMIRIVVQRDAEGRVTLDVVQP
jgi:hypothetical protein